MSKIQIGNTWIGEGFPAVTIAEAGVNHNGSIEKAKELIKKAAESGAWAIKFQTYTADELVCKGTPKFWNWEGDKDKKTQYDAYKDIGGFSYDYYPELIECCEDNDIEFISTAFSFEGADFLHSIGMRAFKVASSDMSHLPYLKHIARYEKPILLSTGAATMSEVEESVQAIRNAGNDQIILLHCTLCYPTKNEDANLNIIQTLKDRFPYLEVGISDHTLGVFPAVISVAMGATVIEKHFTLDKTLDRSADHWLSVDPQELTEMVSQIREVEKLKGYSDKIVFPCEQETRKYDKRSVVSKVPIKKGVKITEDMITYKRPGTGLWPRHAEMIIGSAAKENIKADVPITVDMI